MVVRFAKKFIILIINLSIGNKREWKSSFPDPYAIAATKRSKIGIAG